MVTGGDVFFGMYRDTTELFDTSAGSWRVVEGQLPAPMYGLRAVTVGNRVMAFGESQTLTIKQLLSMILQGGYTGDYLDTILEFDLESEKWLETDSAMAMAMDLVGVRPMGFED